MPAGDYLKGRTYEEVFGKEKAKELRQRLSDKAKLQGRKPPSRLGYRHTKEAKQKIKKHAMLHPRGCCTSEYANTDEERKRRSERTKLRRGCKAAHWKGGVTPENKLIRGSENYINWRLLVFERDNWTCQQCGKRGCELHPHHILGFAKYPDMRFSTTNGVTLCKDCHKRLHGLEKKTKGA